MRLKFRLLNVVGDLPVGHEIEMSVGHEGAVFIPVKQDADMGVLVAPVYLEIADPETMDRLDREIRAGIECRQRLSEIRSLSYLAADQNVWEGIRDIIDRDPRLLYGLEKED